MIMKSGDRRGREDAGKKRIKAGRIFGDASVVAELRVTCKAHVSTLDPSSSSSSSSRISPFYSTAFSCKKKRWRKSPGNLGKFHRGWKLSFLECESQRIISRGYKQIYSKRRFFKVGRRRWIAQVFSQHDGWASVIFYTIGRLRWWVS